MNNTETLIETVQTSQLSESDLLTLSEVVWDEIKAIRTRKAKNLIRQLSPGMHVRVRPGCLKDNSHDNKVYEVIDPKRTRVLVRINELQTVLFPASALELA